MGLFIWSQAPDCNCNVILIVNQQQTTGDSKLTSWDLFSLSQSWTNPSVYHSAGLFHKKKRFYNRNIITWSRFFFNISPLLILSFMLSPIIPNKLFCSFIGWYIFEPPTWIYWFCFIISKQNVSKWIPIDWRSHGQFLWQVLCNFRTHMVPLFSLVRYVNKFVQNTLPARKPRSADKNFSSAKIYC